MNIRVLFISILTLMGASIIMLVLILSTPLEVTERPVIQFENIINGSQIRRNNLSRVDFTYNVNLTDNGRNIIGTMRFIKNDSGETTILSGNLLAYKDTVLVLNPIELMDEIQNNTFQEYMGAVNYTNNFCFGLRTYPLMTDRRRLVNGDLAVVSYIEVYTGYPLQTFIIERNSKGELAYSEIFIDKIDFEEAV